jgi:hypothetical protein
MAEHAGKPPSRDARTLPVIRARLYRARCCDGPSW